MRRLSKKLGLKKESLHRMALAAVTGAGSVLRGTDSGGLKICDPSFCACSPEPPSYGTGCAPTQCY